MPRERFDQARRSSPAFDAEIVEHGARWSEHLVALVLEAWFSPADTRVLRRLADVASRTATAAEAGAGAGGPASDRTVTVRITQDELAMLSGCSRPTVNRALAGAARAGLLTSARGSITISRLHQLRAHADMA